MEDFFIGEIRFFAFTYVPDGFIMCDGRMLNISQYQALFAVIGTTYGGDGKDNFAAPDLRGQAAIAPGKAATGGVEVRALGAKYGIGEVTLRTDNMPSHTHQLVRIGSSWTANKKLSTPTTTSSLGGMLNGTAAINSLKHTGVPDTNLSPQTIQAYGGGGAHDNIQPCLALIPAIAYMGEFPSQA